MVWSVPQRDHSGVRGWGAMGDRPGGTPEFMTRVWVDVWPFQEVGVQEEEWAGGKMTSSVRVCGT